MPVRTFSQRFSHLQWRRLLKELWGRPTTSADFGSSLWQVPYTSNVCLLEDKVQDRGMYLFTIPYGSDALDQRSGVGWISGWIKNFVIYSRYFNAKFWSIWCEDCFSAEQNHPQFSFQKKNQSGGTKGPKAGSFLSWQTDCLLDLRLLPGHWSPWFCRKLYRPVHHHSTKWWYSGIRFEVGRHFVHDEDPTWWQDAKLKEKQKWSNDKLHLENARKLRGIYFIDPEDKEFKETIKNARKKLETSVAPTMPCKIARNCGSRASIKIQTKLACILEADESTRMRMGNSMPHNHQDHIAGKGGNSLQHYNLVHKFIPMPQAMKIPAASGGQGLGKTGENFGVEPDKSQK